MGETFARGGQSDANADGDDALEPGDEQRSLQTGIFQLATQKNLVDEHQRNGHQPWSETNAAVC